MPAIRRCLSCLSPVLSQVPPQLGAEISLPGLCAWLSPAATSGASPLHLPLALGGLNARTPVEPALRGGTGGPQGGRAGYMREDGLASS